VSLDDLFGLTARAKRRHSAEIGAAVLFFASPSARPITNQVLAVDGRFSVS
jgi:enoyl-[acyl-carrier-protein] reductase (NADH)